MPDSLFIQQGRSKHRYTMTAGDLDVETMRAVRPVFERYLLMGYSPREIYYIMEGAIKDMELQSLLRSEEIGDLQPPSVLPVGEIPVENDGEEART